MWYVYVLESQQNKRLYVGMTSDLNKRLQDHNLGRGGGYTKKNYPYKIIFYEVYSEKSDALAAEKFLKSGYGREVLKKDKLKMYFKKKK